MSNQFKTGILLIMLALFALAGASVFAQEQTATVMPEPMGSEAATVVPPPSFTDGRINSNTLLGGLAIYCVDQSSNPTNTFANGGITVWGVGDQKYVNLSTAQLGDNNVIPQTPSALEMQMTQTAPAPEPSMTQEPLPMMEVTAEVMGQTVTLLAQATTPTGEIGFFKLGADQFALQGYDEAGQLFTYTWTGCSEGMVQRGGESYLADITPAATVEFPTAETPEATPGM